MINLQKYVKRMATRGTWQPFNLVTHNNPHKSQKYEILIIIVLRQELNHGLIASTGHQIDIQWNLPVTTTSIINSLPVIYSVMCFNEDWRYEFTLAKNVCLLDHI